MVGKQLPAISCLSLAKVEADRRALLLVSSLASFSKAMHQGSLDYIYIANPPLGVVLNLISCNQAEDKLLWIEYFTQVYLIFQIRCFYPKSTPLFCLKAHTVF